MVKNMKKLLFLIITILAFSTNSKGQEFMEKVEKFNRIDSTYSSNDITSLIKKFGENDSSKNPSLLIYSNFLVKDSMVNRVKFVADSLYDAQQYESAIKTYELHIDISELLALSIYKGIKPIKYNSYYAIGLRKYEDLIDAADYTMDRLAIDRITSYLRVGKSYEMLGEMYDALETYTDGLDNISIYNGRDRQVFAYNQLRTALFELIGTDWFNEYGQN